MTCPIASLWSSLWDALNPSSVIALCALMVAVVTVAARLRHDRLSVRPFLVLDLRAPDTKVKANGLVVTYVLTNKGLGPALVRRFEFLLDDVPQVNVRNEGVLQLVEKCYPDEVLQVEVSTPNEDYVLRAGEEYQLLRVTFPALLRGTDQNEFVKRILRIGVRIRYSSFYKTPFVLDTRNRQRVQHV